MLPAIVSPPLRTKQQCSIKIKSPKSDIKVHRLNFSDSTKISPELASKGNMSNLHNDDMEKLTQCWNNLKVRALSKAIVIAPDVGACSIGPKSLTPLLDGVEPLNIDSDKPDLSQAITSTPVKGQPISKSVTKTDSFNLSQVKEFLSDSNSSDEDSSHMEILRIIFQNKIEAYIDKCVQEKRESLLKSWQAHDQKMKEKCWVLKTELNNERILRTEEQDNAVQKILMETEANAQIKAQQQRQQKVDHDKRIAETGEKLRQIEQKRKEAEEKRKRSIEELKRCMEDIYNLQVIYNRKYSQICEMNKTCKDIRLLKEKVSGELPKLKAMNGLMFKLAEKSNEGKVTSQDLKSAEALVLQITIISDIFTKSVYEINKSLEEANKPDVDEAKQLHKEDPRAKPEEAVPPENIEVQNFEKPIEYVEKPIEYVENPKAIQKAEKLSYGVEDCISNECLTWHLELRNYLEDYENKLEPLISSTSFKKFRFDCQKVVNVPVNAISPLDDLHLEDKLYKLSRILQGQAAPLGSSLFLVTGHPLGVSFCTNLLAKKFVKQGEHAVSSKPEAAFAIAAVIVALWVDFPEFGRLLLAHFHRECPYLIPAFLPQVEGQSNESYYRMLGYQYSEDGKVESQDKFLRRMSGVMRLYAAILVTPLKRSQVAEGKQHPHSMKEAWRWITAILNLSPRPDISPTLLLNFLEVAGGMMYKTYRAQFTKLLQYLWSDYYPMIEQVTPDGCGGPVTRLSSFLVKILKGQVPIKIPAEQESEKIKLTKEIEELKEKCTELETSLDLMRVEFEKCEDYWQGKLNEERAIFDQEQKLSDDKFVELEAKIQEYAELFNEDDRKNNGRLPTIEEKDSLEKQVTDLEEEFEEFKRTADKEARSKSEQIERLHTELNTLLRRQKEREESMQEVGVQTSGHPYEFRLQETSLRSQTKVCLGVAEVDCCCPCHGHVLSQKGLTRLRDSRARLQAECDLLNRRREILLHQLMQIHQRTNLLYSPMPDRRLASDIEMFHNLSSRLRHQELRCRHLQSALKHHQRQTDKLLQNAWDQHKADLSIVQKTLNLTQEKLMHQTRLCKQQMERLTASDVLVKDLYKEVQALA